MSGGRERGARGLRRGGRKEEKEVRDKRETRGRRRGKERRRRRRKVALGEETRVRGAWRRGEGNRRRTEEKG